MSEAQSCWSVGHDHPSPEGVAVCKQKLWDELRAISFADQLLAGVENEECNRLLSVSTKESGAWLRTLPVTALGL